MNKHRLTVYGLALAVLAALVYLQFREWRTFDWGKFIEHSRDVTWRHVIHGIVLIYLAYILRAIRWKIFLRPVRKDVSSFSMISPTLVGFTGLAVLGRPGELIDYDEANFQEREVKAAEECLAFREKPTVTWINVEGVHQVEVVEKLGNCFGLHPLVLEDILNTDQRPKLEIYGDYVYIVLKMLYGGFHSLGCCAHRERPVSIAAIHSLGPDARQVRLAAVPKHLPDEAPPAVMLPVSE